MSAELSELTVDAVNHWLADTSNNGLTLGITPRRFNEAKFQNDDVTLNPLQMPAIITEATQGKQIHNIIPMYLMEVDTVLWMHTDDTTKTRWDDVAEGIESLFSVADLASFLTGGSFRCGGIVTRNLGQLEHQGRVWKRSYRLQLWGCRNP